MDRKSVIPPFLHCLLFLLSLCFCFLFFFFFPPLFTSSDRPPSLCHGPFYCRRERGGRRKKARSDVTGTAETDEQQMAVRFIIFCTKVTTHNFWACWILFSNTMICTRRNQNNYERDQSKDLQFPVNQLNSSYFPDHFCLQSQQYLIFLMLHVLHEVKLLRLQLVDPVPHLLGPLPWKQRQNLERIWTFFFLLLIYVF